MQFLDQRKKPRHVLLHWCCDLRVCLHMVRYLMVLPPLEDQNFCESQHDPQPADCWEPREDGKTETREVKAHKEYNDKSAHRETKQENGEPSALS